MIVDPWFLCKALRDQPSLVSRNRPVWISFECKDPLATYNIKRVSSFKFSRSQV